MHDGLPGNEKVRTKDKALKRIVQMLEVVGNIEWVALVHTNAHERVDELKKMAEHLLPKGELMVENITPVIGAHIGPGAAGFAVIAAE